MNVCVKCRAPWTGETCECGCTGYWALEDRPCLSTVNAELNGLGNVVRSSRSPFKGLDETKPLALATTQPAQFGAGMRTYRQVLDR
jgi:hypothetical protein